MLLAQRQQFFDFGQREPQLLGMPHKLEFANLLSNEQAIPALAATRTLNESEFLKRIVSTLTPARLAAVPMCTASAMH